MSELLFSVDIEASGPVHGTHSMFSIGAVAYGPGAAMYGKFSVNLEMWPGSVMAPATQRFWDYYPEAYAIARENPKPILEGVMSFHAWVRDLGSQLNLPCVGAAWPSNFDFGYIDWYGLQLGLETPFETVMDMRSFAAGKLGLPMVGCGKVKLPYEYKKDLPSLTHIAVEDAEVQGIQLCRLYYGRDPHSHLLVG